jgi:hypothetical protein
MCRLFQWSHPVEKNCLVSFSVKSVRDLVKHDPHTGGFLTYPKVQMPVAVQRMPFFYETPTFVTISQNSLRDFVMTNFSFW